MWKTVQIFNRTLPRYFSGRPVLRTYLKHAYSLDGAWDKRLDSPYLKKINISDMFYELENQFLHFGKANGLDIDLFTNAISTDGHIDEVEDVIHKLRLSPEAHSLLPSTQHAFIRLMISFGDINELLRILDDRLNYGIFMDDYTCILLLNKFLKVENFIDAARVASIHMLQEDFSHPIVKSMSLYACHKFALEPKSWIPKEEEESKESKAASGEEEDDEEWIRVRYIRNVFFDDHFDLRNPAHLVGKTLWMIGNQTPDAVGRSYSLMGYTLHEKWDTLQIFIKGLLNSKENPVVYKESISIARDWITKEPLKEENKTTDTEPEDASKKKDILTLLSQLENSGSIIEGLLETTEDQMKKTINEDEEATLNTQLKIYELWQLERNRLVEEHIEKVKREKMLAEIEAAKKKIKEEEDRLFFFENEDKLDVIIENKIIRYPNPKKWLGKKKQKRDVHIEYIPPDVGKSREE